MQRLRTARDFMELTPRQQQLLRLRVKKWNGLVRVFVHPLFEKWHYPPHEYHTHREYERLMQIERVLSRLIAMPERKTPPIIIMEEAYRLRKLKAWLNTLGQGIQSNGYFIKTETDTPTPRIDGVRYCNPSWAALTKKMQLIGIRKMLMGGMQFSASAHSGDWTGKPPYVARCLGIALSYLSKDKAGKFEVDLSALVDCSYSRRVYIQVVNETRLKQQARVAAP